MVNSKCLWIPASAAHPGLVDSTSQKKPCNGQNPFPRQNQTRQPHQGQSGFCLLGHCQVVQLQTGPVQGKPGFATRVFLEAFVGAHGLDLWRLEGCPGLCLGSVQFSDALQKGMIRSMPSSPCSLLLVGQSHRQAQVLNREPFLE